MEQQQPSPPLPHSATMHCLGCGYALDGLPEARCPECGRGFDPFDSTTFRRLMSDQVRLCVAPTESEARAIADQLRQARIACAQRSCVLEVAQRDVERARVVLRKPDDSFRCAQCNEAMVPGYVWSHTIGPSLGLSSVVWAAIPPAETPRGEYGPDEVVAVGMQRAHRCPKCSRITIEPSGSPGVSPRPETYEIACLACGAAIPAGESSCPDCGWSYEAREGADEL